MKIVSGIMPIVGRLTGSFDFSFSFLLSVMIRDFICEILSIVTALHDTIGETLT